MLFNSAIFIFAFLPITLAGYYALLYFSHRELTLAWLTLCSLAFYGWWNPAHLWLITISIAFNYATGRLISRPGRFRRAGLMVGIITNLAALGYYKYYDFFIGTLNSALATDFNFQHIVLPLAISFFTFTQIAFLVDSYRGEANEYNFLHYCLFVTFFTHLIAGPIVHHKELLPQFLRDEKLRFHTEQFAIGITIFIFGLFKKIILSDSLSSSVSHVYGSTGVDGAANPDFIHAWISTLSYTLQLYFDFSGYSDMAIGLSLLFGVKLPINFNSPYKSRSIIEFWHRWHITLSNFLRDYLYIALGGNRKGPVRRYLNLWVTMLLGGAWHGASVNFIVWGGLHGAYLVCNHAWRALCHGVIDLEPPKLIRPLITASAVGLTFLATVFAWVFFRADTLHSATTIASAMLGKNGFSIAPVSADFAAISGALKQVVLEIEKIQNLNWLQKAISFTLSAQKIDFGTVGTLATLATLLLVVWFLPNTSEVFRKHEPALGLDRSNVKVRWGFALTPQAGLAIGIVAMFTLSRLFSGTPSEFMYFNF
ncbi:MBOAT family O-acyltransferase [Cupriavidus sp. RAF12]|uniref:MBOAT family O-acyltransferase n=1 Tax=Cupriavidus sp. RAF12 TaxID=3233050 RepID=UPI003F8EEFAB